MLLLMRIVSTNEIEIHIRSNIDNESDLKRQLKNQIKSMQDYLEWIKIDVKKHNEWIRENVKKKIE